MQKRIKAFIDSNVVVSALKSSTGAAYVLEGDDNILKIISNLSRLEVLKTIKRLELDEEAAMKTLEEKFEEVDIGNNLPAIGKKFRNYVRDSNDSHVVGAAVKSRAKFLITHNLKHFDMGKIKRDLNILVMSPGQFLQYLRSI